MSENVEIPEYLKPCYESATAGLSGGKLLTMQEAFSCLVRLRQVQAALNAEPLTVHSARSGIDRANPLLGVETALRMQFARLAKQTGLSRHYIPSAPSGPSLHTRAGRIAAERAAQDQREAEDRDQ